MVEFTTEWFVSFISYFSVMFLPLAYAAYILHWAKLNPRKFKKAFTFSKSITQRFHDGLNLKSFQLSKSLDILQDMKPSDLNEKYQDSIPILHYMMQLYLKSKEPNIRKDLVQLMVACIRGGADVNDNYRRDYSILSKAIIAREIALSQEIAQAGSQISSSEIFNQLYLISTEAVFLTRVLLQANSLALKINDTSMPTLCNILSTLDAKNVVQHEDLYFMSKKYKEILTSMTTTANPIDIQLKDVFTSLNETTAEVHKILMSTAVKSEASLEHLSRLFCKKDFNDRNLLHFLGISGNELIINQMILAFKNFPDNEIITSNVEISMKMRDCRGHTPLSYTHMRFKNTTVLDRMRAFVTMFVDDHNEVNELQKQQPISLSKDEGNDDDDDDDEIEINQEFINNNNDMSVIAQSIQIDNKTSDELMIDAADGGWDSFSLDTSAFPNIMVSPHPCPIKEIFTGLPNETDFLNNYIAVGEPVIFRGGAIDFSIRQKFQRETFLQTHGDRILNVSAIPYAKTFGLEDIMISLQTMSEVEEEKRRTSTDTTTGIPLYVFQALPNKNDPISMDAPVPLFLPGGDQARVTKQFYLGSAGSGAPSHYHGHAVNILAYGEKQWYIYPPSQSFYTTSPSAEFVRRSNGCSTTLATAIQFTQHAGDVVYLPALWGHGTLNLKQSIGVAYEFSVEEFPI